ncbi:M48 family metallopeptidase [Altericista sp. CCNU0014]|uniref:M48 family metallopeptidase n=1 Tax=Altericista sp. CCNU0014 TaxID=3082949 RepID=UPI00384DE846
MIRINLRLSKLLPVSRRWRNQIASFVAIALFSCATVASAQAIPVQELLFRGIQAAQLSNLSDQQEMQIGAQMHQNLLSQNVRLSADPVLNDFVTDIGQRLVPFNRRARLPYNFYVVQDKNVNAFATMGGYVYVTTGLLRTADNEAQVASVVGHEMGHIERKHLLQQMRQTMLAQGFASALLGQNRRQLANIGVDLLVRRPLSREDEYQADQVGLRLVRDANYATSEMPEFMRKLVQGSGRTATILSTHPAVPDRLRALDKAIRSGPTNRCDGDRRLPICGVDEVEYRNTVGQRV